MEPVAFLHALSYALLVLYHLATANYPHTDNSCPAKMARLFKTGRNMLGQCALISAPAITESNLPTQHGKVFIVTGANTGIGKSLARILYSKHGKVYAAGRSLDKLNAAIGEIQQTHSDSQGELIPLVLDLSDLSSIKGSVDAFTARESRLHVLWNNAGVMMPPHGSKTPQGHELQVGTNCLGPWLFTELLRPVLEETARNAPKDSVRVAWAGSLAIDLQSPKGGARFDDVGNVKMENSPPGNYGVSKAGNLFLAREFGRTAEGVVSVCFNPGNLRTDLQRHVTKGIPKFVQSGVQSLILYDGVMGAYTELFCGFSDELSTADNGVYVAPWGRKSFNRTDIEVSKKSKDDGGNGNAEKFAEFVRKETKPYLQGKL
ncbi:MAG: hypothetical protein Q9162_004823 [Coniocarpon cinnabarinum]